MSENIVTELAAGVLRIEMRRPEKKNALTGPMYAAMADALERAAREDAVRVVLIHGQPEMFTAGNDLGDFLNGPTDDPDRPVFRFLRNIAAAEKPLVAAVSGNAVGVGTTMLLHCDLVYAGENARFQLPFVNLALCPEAASSLLLPRLVGHPRAAELLFFGEPFGATEAHEIGLANAVLPDAGVLAHALERAQKLATLPAASLRETKRLLKQAVAALVPQTMRDEGEIFKRQLASPAAKEAFSAFLEKRKPDFSKF
ncbi:MAG: enoyl-CoA hydratase [Alphaproteobacteria bacterium]|nr:enoyl-CoA hydratase [Betaproteobacteria bacterium]MBM3564326.1 enoyl-CoA hydratase [Alphaproteobacteria bacterium]